MKKPLHITIPTPCHEKWEEMRPTEQGAYFKACQKNVIDFTRKTQNEIYDIVSQGGDNMCGRFFATQIQEPVVRTEINPTWFNWRAIAASLAALVAGKYTVALNTQPLPTFTLEQDTSTCKNNINVDSVTAVTKDTVTIPGHFEVIIEAPKVQPIIHTTTTTYTIERHCPVIKASDTIECNPNDNVMDVVIVTGGVERQRSPKAFFRGLGYLIKHAFTKRKE